MLFVPAEEVEGLAGRRQISGGKARFCFLLSLLPRERDQG